MYEYIFKNVVEILMGNCHKPHFYPLFPQMAFPLISFCTIYLLKYIYNQDFTEHSHYYPENLRKVSLLQ
jgi:hypothetical protein